MIEKKPLTTLRISDDARRKLRFYSKSLTEGKNIDYRTPMFSVNNARRAPVDSQARISGEKALKPIARDFIVKCFIPNILNLVRDFPVIKKFESEFIKYSLSSRSLEKPGAKKKEKLEQSFNLQEQPLALAGIAGGQDKLQCAAAELAKYVRKYIPARSLRPSTIPYITQRMTKDSNGGFPYLVRAHVVENGVIIQDNVPKYVDIALKIQNLISTGKTIPLEYKAFGALSRLQEGHDKDNNPETKNRIVGGDAHGCTILAGYAYPFLDACKRLPTRKILNGLDDVNKQLAELVRNTNHKVILSADQSAFDNHIRGEIVTNYIAPIILESFNWTGKANERAALEGYITEHMGADPIVCPDGVGFGRHGMPSGVLFVNEIDSMYLQLVTYLYNAIHGTEVYQTIAVQGDDQVMTVTTTEDLTADQFEKDSALMNLEANKDKQGVSKVSCTFVKRLGTLECADGYRSKIGSLIAEMNMERAKDGKFAMYEARGGAILCNHYLTEPGISEFFAQISMGYTKYQLGYNLVNGYLGVLQLAGGVEKVSSRLDLSSYANHLATKPVKQDAWSLDVLNMTLQTWQLHEHAEGKNKLVGSWVGDSIDNDGKQF